MGAFRVFACTYTDDDIRDGEIDAPTELLAEGRLTDCIPAVAGGFCRPRWAGAPEPSCSCPEDWSWLTWEDQHPYTGARTITTLHAPDTVTGASRARILRLFG